MGVKLVKRAYAYRVDVPLHPNEFALLGYMAATALDADNPPRYFDSREASALALGRRVPDQPDGHPTKSPACPCPVCRARRAAFESVRVALRGLVSVGAIERIKVGRAGQRAEYALRLDVSRSRLTKEYRARLDTEQAWRQVAGPAWPTIQGASGPQSQSAPGPKEGQRRTQEPTRGITSVDSTTPLGRVVQVVSPQVGRVLDGGAAGDL